MNKLRFGWAVIAQTALWIKTNTGRMLRETGLFLDRKGSQMTKDIAYLEPINRHRNILNLD